MSITKILSDKDISAEDKLNRVADTIGAARKAYGNSDVEIESPMVPTPRGEMSFVHLEPESQVELLRNEVAEIKMLAVEAAQQNPGININKRIEELLATNPAFVNIGGGTNFEYI